MKKYTIESINSMTKSWMSCNDDKSKRAWNRLLKDTAK